MPRTMQAAAAAEAAAVAAAEAAAACTIGAASCGERHPTVAVTAAVARSRLSCSEVKS